MFAASGALSLGLIAAKYRSDTAGDPAQLVSTARDGAGAFARRHPDVDASSDNGQVTEQPDSPPYRGQIRRVEGRNTKGGKRSGLPKIHEIELEHQGGLRIEAHSHKPPTGDGTRTATGVCVIEPGQFPYCPICLREDIPAATMEHIPPKAFGGAAMANTCADCNNGLGSRTEAALQDWFDGAIRARFTSGSSPQPFGHDRILMLTTEAGECVMLAEKSSPEGASPFDRLKDPNVEIHYTFPRPAEYKTGLLKSAYLAACLHFGGVAHAPSMMAARDELLRARDAKSRRGVVIGPIAEKLTAHRTGLAANGPTLALLRSDHEGESTYLISLAGTILVEWPFVDLDVMLSPRMGAA